MITTDWKRAMREQIHEIAEAKTYRYQSDFYWLFIDRFGALSDVIQPNDIDCTVTTIDQHENQTYMWVFDQYLLLEITGSDTADVWMDDGNYTKVAELSVRNDCGIITLINGTKNEMLITKDNVDTLFKIAFKAYIS